MSVGCVSVGVFVRECECVRSCVTLKFKCDRRQKCVGVHVDMWVWEGGDEGGGEGCKSA